MLCGTGGFWFVVSLRASKTSVAIYKKEKKMTFIQWIATLALSRYARNDERAGLTSENSSARNDTRKGVVLASGIVYNDEQISE